MASSSTRSSSTQWPPALRFVPGALVAAGLAWDALAPADYWGDPMIAAACVVAGALFSLRHVLLVGAALTVGIIILSVRDGLTGHTAGYLELANTLFAVAIGIGVNRVIARYGHRLAVVRSVAEAAQRAVLPAPPERIGPLVFAACYRAAQTEALIGGDAYAVQQTPHGTRLLIADVRGKGLGAVRAVSVLLGAFREAAEQAPDLGALADRLEHSLQRELADAEEELRLEGFITALLGEITPDAGLLRLLNCGHPAAYLFDGAAVRTLEAGEPGLPLGMGGLGLTRPAADSWPFAPGETLLLLTDGVTEARNGAGTFYDPATRLRDRGPFGRPQQVIDTLVGDVEEWTGGPRDDDMAVLAVTRSAERAHRGGSRATTPGGRP
ncbi:serine phosphatase RsbU (regulator of sigma subunit) [Kitasatospora sp. MAP12-15]|uniref:PP2C family protein-serine/threonine phosphatase n=1 Tax=unclassified Kitasatospora TaxID=2633591 RepID=UPI002475F9E9|nr:PP2C family protein-serine/threonine phosphatase [Kitasatospora sp. MAP12-44]MDH6115025.1 serine phosphatase RsbU (regulator of sigma subunit) [Kitasatospora sp. MAP12-44]